MPYYIYTNEQTGKSIERLFRIGTAPQTVKFEGQILHRDIAAEWKGRTKSRAKWPMWSEFGGVGPAQVPDVQEYLKARGVQATDFNSEGDVKWESPGHRRAYLKARDMVDLGGYD
jgi:hypothetical protein